jgi:hypothetical protein
MLKPLGPFYPGAHHTSAGKQFSLGFEGANIVQDVFGATHGGFDASVAELTRPLRDRPRHRAPAWGRYRRAPGKNLQ